MATNAGFKIGDQEYEWPSALKITDYALIEEITGLDSTEFAERVDRLNVRKESGEEIADPVVASAWIGVGVWHAHPRWKRSQVIAFLQGVDNEQFQEIGGDDGPPSPGAQAAPNPSPEPSDEPTITPEPSQEKDLA